MAGPDPFYAVRDAVGNDIKALQTKFAVWKDLLGSVNTATNMDFRLKHEDFVQSLAKSEEMCKKVKIAVARIETDRTRFANVDDRELQSRKAFADNFERTLAGMKEIFNSRETRGKIDADQKRELNTRAVSESRAAAGPTAYNVANSEFVNTQSQQQTQIRREQDETLGKMANSLDVLDNMARTIESELKDQEVLMNDIDSEMTVAQSKMDSAMKSVEKLLKTKDKCQLCTIALLVVAFLIVAIIAFYVLTG